MRAVPSWLLPGTLIASLIVLGLSDGTAFSSGAPAGLTGAPNEQTCIVCHSDFALNSGSANYAISGPTALLSQNPITMNIQWGNTATPLRGFEVTVRDNNDQFAGRLVITDPANTQFPFGNTDYLTHTSAGNQQLGWTFDWSPPTNLAAGPVRFYASGNEANGNRNTMGDFIYTAQTTVYQAELSTQSTTWPLGSVQSLSLSSPRHPNEDYVIALSSSLGASPLGNNLELPVDISSPFFFLAFQLPTLFQNFIGVLDGQGNAAAAVVVPPIPALSGLGLHLAFASFDVNASATEVSNPISVTLQ